MSVFLMISCLISIGAALLCAFAARGAVGPTIFAMLNAALFGWNLRTLLEEYLYEAEDPDTPAETEAQP